jgi:oligopeptide transport system substrate-binding protein
MAGAIPADKSALTRSSEIATMRSSILASMCRQLPFTIASRLMLTMYNTRFARRRARPRFWSTLPMLLALSATLVAGCTTSTNGKAQLSQSQVFIYPNQLLGTNGPNGYTVLPNIALDPGYLFDLYSLRVMSMIQVQLVTFDANLHVIPDAAQSFTASDGGKTWTFVLRPGLEWSDGTTMTSADFMTAFKHELDPNLCSESGPLQTYIDTYFGSTCTGAQPAASFLAYITGVGAYSNGKASSISGIQTPDPQTIVFHLTQPIAYFPDIMATSISAPLETSVFGQYGNNFILHYTSGVAQSGPFVIAGYTDPSNPSVTDPTKATEIVFKQNPHWWGKPMTLTEVDMPLMPAEGNQNQYDAYTSNQANYADVPTEQYTIAKDYPDFHATTALNLEYIDMNELNAPFDNTMLRQALDLALNKQFIVDTALAGAATETNHIIPQGIPGYNPNLLGPPDASKGTTALTGNQSLAQQDIVQLANSCKSDYSQDFCPYIVGTPPLNSTSTTLNPNCPVSYPVGAVMQGGKLVTTQKPIVLTYRTYKPYENPIGPPAVQQWDSVLCLNAQGQGLTSTSYTLTRPNPSQIYNPSDYTSMWIIGYAADYPDPEDFTTLQFDPLNGVDNGNFGWMLNSQGYPVLNPADQALANQMRAADADQSADRYQRYEQIEQQLVDDAVWIPIAQIKFLYRVSSYVENFSLTANGYVPDQEWPNVAILAH